MTADEAVIERMLDLGFHLLPLDPGARTWPERRGPRPAANLTQQAAVSHVRAGGNLAIDLSRTRLVVIHGVDSDAVKYLCQTGLVPTVAYPYNPHLGHPADFYLTTPEGISSSTMLNLLKLDYPIEKRVYAQAAVGIILCPPSRFRGIGEDRYTSVPGGLLA